jgi:excinuclease ABC subunit C
MEIPLNTLQNGQKIIRRYVERLPGTPGVYRMLDAKGEALYIGKAKHLKNRVSSYLNLGALGLRMQQVVSQTVTMEFTTTRSEAEALLLEANLVKKLSPRYNMLLKDDKSFPYILLSGDHDYPRIAKHRGAKIKKGKYFGPFTSGLAVNETITLLQKAFLLRPCADTVFKNRTRPCLQHQIKRCSAPCVRKISKEDYAKLVLQGEEFLSGKSQNLQNELIAEMQELSFQMKYEKATVVRDRLKALAQIAQQGTTTAVGDADIVALARNRKNCCIQLFSYRGGRNWGNRAWFPEHTESMGDGEIISGFLTRIYQTQVPPALILVSHLVEDGAVLEEALRLRADYKVEVLQPLRGPKCDLVAEAKRNAEEALTRHLALQATQAEVLLGVQKIFGMEDIPHRIEVYDNSHISGTHATGAMIVAGPEGFIKSEYRKFNIKREETVPGDDYAMMREVLARRFRRLEEVEEEQDERKHPNIILIDGGAGQLAVAQKVLEDAGTQSVCVVAIAKGPDRNAGREQFFMLGREPFQLPPDDPVLHYLQRLRDEAHRFAIGVHRAKRSKAIHISELDAIPGIGATRKKALLLHFGSARAVSAASLNEIAKVEGISHTTAQMIYNHFHS